jgi:hypothetical protein
MATGGDAVVARWRRSPGPRRPFTFGAITPLLLDVPVSGDRQAQRIRCESSKGRWPTAVSNIRAQTELRHARERQLPTAVEANAQAAVGDGRDPKYGRNQR